MNEVEVDLASTVPGDSVSVFALQLADAQGNQYTVPFTLPVRLTQPDFEILSASLSVPGTAPQGTRCLTLSLEDSGAGTVYELTGTLSSTTAGVTVVNAGLSFGTLFLDDYADQTTTMYSPNCPANQVEVDLSPQAAANGPLPFVLSLSDSAGTAYSLEFSL
jgi:hypothetical protein